MMLHAGADSATPGKPLPPGTTILAAYVGAPDLPARPDAKHVWTPDEWNLYLDPASPLYGGPELRALPIFVHDFAGDPIAIADNAADALLDLGWGTGIGRLVYLDLETLVNALLVDGVERRLHHRGFVLGKYGSQGTINRNPPVPGGTWMATDSKVPPLALPEDRVGDQWLFGPVWDLTGFSKFVYAGCGQGPRRARP